MAHLANLPHLADARDCAGRNPLVPDASEGYLSECELLSPPSWH